MSTVKNLVTSELITLINMVWKLARKPTSPQEQCVPKIVHLFVMSARARLFAQHFALEIITILGIVSIAFRI